MKATWWLARTVARLALTFGFVACAGVEREPEAPGPHRESSDIEELAEAAALYHSACSTCHLPPDPEHATDRAWLNQVTDTA